MRRVRSSVDAMILRRAGRSLSLLVLVLALLVVGLVWFFARDSGEVSEPIVQTESPRTPALPSVGPKLDPSQAHSPAPRSAAPEASPSDPVPESKAPVLGTIHVRVRGTDGRPFTGSWTLEIHEHVAGLVGRERRALEQTAPTASVEARTGRVHVLSARSSDLASPHVRCDLGTSPATAEVELVLGDAGIVGGLVVDEHGHGVGGLSVWLVPRIPAVQARLGADGRPAQPPLPVPGATDASGRFRMFGLQSGTWTLVAGHLDAPIARQDGVIVATGETRLDPLALPPLHMATVRVEDEHGAAVPGAQVSSRGSHGGAIEGVTDAYGELACKHLPAGRWRVFASTSDARRGNVTVEVPLESADARIEVTLRAVAPRPERNPR